MPDRYTYPDSEVLVNLPGYRDPAAWHEAETALVQIRMAELTDHPLPGDFGLDHLRAIHRHLTQDLYIWGGQLRDTDTGPAGTGLAHCRPEFIPAEAERIFGRLAAEQRLTGLDRDAFAGRLSWVWGETTALHPFRDVNTRSQFVFFNDLARQAGWVIDWRQIDPHVFAHARTLAIAQDERGIEALLQPALLTVADAARHDELVDHMTEIRLEHLRPRPARPVTELDADLRRAIEARRSRLAPPESFGQDSPVSGIREPPSLGL
ncbi:MAG: hypothetical protein B7X41_17365 [Microbacterium sp. 14-71-5]|nr:MAG: hypothetical protein B7X41_17365 [Microbacterium sp. 14-71-5]